MIWTVSIDYWGILKSFGTNEQEISQAARKEMKMNLPAEDFRIGNMF